MAPQLGRIKNWKNWESYLTKEKSRFKMKSKIITLDNTEISHIIDLFNHKPEFLKLISKRNFITRTGFFERLKINTVTDNSVTVKYISGNNSILLHFQKLNNAVTLQISKNSLYYLFLIPLSIIFRNFFKTNSVADINGSILIGMILFSAFLGIIMYAVGKYNLNNIVSRFEIEFAKAHISRPRSSYPESNKPVISNTYFFHNGVNQEGPFAIIDLKDKLKKEHFV